MDIQRGNINETDKQIEGKLRPDSFTQFSGQPSIVENLKIFVQAAKMRGEALDHVLLHGPPGLGKTTLSNGLTGIEAATGGIREDDAKGRHVTTARSLRPMKNGGWLIDTPGMRALRLADATDGINALFDDVVELAGQCKFSNCAHDTEPGCAVQAAIAAGDLEAERLTRWRKLMAEDERNNQSLAQSRARDKAFGKMVHTTLKGAHHKKGR